MQNIMGIKGLTSEVVKGLNDWNHLGIKANLMAMRDKSVKRVTVCDVVDIFMLSDEQQEIVANDYDDKGDGSYLVEVDNFTEVVSSMENIMRINNDPIFFGHEGITNTSCALVAGIDNGKYWESYLYCECW